MYSQQLQDHLQEAVQLAEVEPQQSQLLGDSLACYLNAFALAIKGRLSPPADLLTTSLNLLSLSIGLTRLELDAETDGLHYLVGMGLEQSGELLARHYLKDASIKYPPYDNDYWYRLALALLHYMAGGYRVQATSVRRHIERISNEARNGDYGEDYRRASLAIQRLLSGKRANPPYSLWESFLFGREAPDSLQGQRIYYLAQKMRHRRQIALDDLGQGSEGAWLEERGILSQDGVDFWTHYLAQMEKRGITNFTDEQIGQGFHTWLMPDTNLLVVLPTGSGKTIIGELQTALVLAEGKQVVWLLPTRSLVRQTRKELKRAFFPCGVGIDELPTTEDFLPLFTDELPVNRVVAATTPEKLLALIRSNPDSVSNVELLVLDEAQILFDLGRGTTVEYILQEMHRLLPDCRFVFMSAFAEYLARFRDFFSRLIGHNRIIELVSSNRPTRRINGVITNASLGEREFPLIQIFPPGLQTEDGVSPRAFTILLPQNPLGQTPGATKIAQSLLKSVTATQLRTVMFVSTIASTEKQAREVSREIREEQDLPRTDIDRLRVELGRQSVVEVTGQKRIAPHHSALTKLEQYMVEKWTQQKLINAVVATPTLAQGVNLPFDMSIVSFLKRMGTENVPQSEVMNMLGRAGRAGQVSDGICLIAIPTRYNQPLRTLDSTRKYFFRSPTPTSDFLGLSRLVLAATNANVSSPEWLYELGSMSFSEAQTLVSFALSAGKDALDIRESLSDRLLQFPSIQDLQEVFGEAWDILNVLNSHLQPLIENALREGEENALLLDAVAKTGMPIEVLQNYFNAITNDYGLREMEPSQIFEWADFVVSSALDSCQSRQWCASLIGDLNLDDMFEAIRLWRSGATMAEIEMSWQIKPSEKRNRIEVGRFFSHKISLFAQFWGALAVCEELVFPEEANRPLSNIQTLVREGVSSVVELEWLNKIGGIDRVLAHRLSQLTQIEMEPSELGEFIQSRLDQWSKDRLSIPYEVVGDELGALVGILDE